MAALLSYHTIVRCMCIFLLSWCSLCAQPIDSLLSLPKDQQIRAIWDLYLRHNPDRAAHLSELLYLEKEWTQRGLSELAQQTWVVRTYYSIYLKPVYDSPIMDQVNEAIAEARRRAWYVPEAECFFIKGRLLEARGKRFEAMEAYLTGYAKLQDLGYDRYPYTWRHLRHIADLYYRFEDYEAALYYMRETLRVPEVWNSKGLHRITMNTMGLAFQSLHQYDSAMYYFTKAHEEAVQVRDTFWAALTLGNAGEIMVLQGMHTEAKPLLEADFHTSVQYQDIANAVNTALVLAAIHLTINEIHEADSYLSFARANVNRQSYRSMHKFYEQLYRINKIRGDLPAAVIYNDSATIYRDSLYHELDVRAAERAKLNVEMERYRHRFQLLESQRNRQVLIRNATIAVILLLTLLAILWLNRQRVLQRKEAELASVQEQRATEALANAKKELNRYILTIAEKNKLIGQIELKLASLEATYEISEEQRREYRTQLQQSTILTEADWREFQDLFDKVYPGFIERMKTAIPDLTAADMRLLTLTKLSLTPGEMASMLGITYDAIKKSRRRLRMRANLPADASIEFLVDQF